MMDPQLPSEEKSPLLLSIEDNDSNIQNSKHNYNKYRVHGITSGATAVITEFPNYINTCWLSCFVSCLVLFMTMLLLISSINTSTRHRIPRCPPKENVMLDNETIHLVHASEKWSLGELEVLEKILQTYPNYKTHLIVIQNTISTHIDEKPYTENITTKSDISKNNAIQKKTQNTFNHTTVNSILRKFKFIERRAKRKIEENKIGFNMGIRNLLDMLLHSKPNMLPPENNTGILYISKLEEPAAPTTQKPKTIEDIIGTYTQLILENTTYSRAFSESPLRLMWRYLDDNLRIFALRILQLWQYGGVSFSLNGKTSNSSFSLAERESRDRMKLQNFIKLEKLNIQNLPFGIVLSDEEGFRIISKTPCHAFFGEVLNNLRKPGLYKNIKQVLQASVAIFCKHGAVEKQYCDEVLKPSRQ